MSELNLDSPEYLPWRAIVSIAAKDYWKLGVLIDDSPVPSPRTLIVTWRNLPNPGSTCWIADATADKSLIETAAGIRIEDWTPKGHLELIKPVTHIEVDIKRSTTAEKAQSILRGILLQQSDAARIGVITHRTLVEAIENLGEPFDSRIVRVAYYGSGEDRASNSWYGDCDLIVVLGTPRLPPHAVRARLFQLGMLDEATEDGNWSELNWRGWTNDCSRRIVKGAGYQHEVWQQVHRSMVRAAIIQAAGRGRGLLREGCGVLILSNEECGFPLHRCSTVELVPAAAMSVLNALKKTLDRVGVLERLEVSTSEVAEAAGLSASRTREWLKWLHQSGLIERRGQRGGWRMPSGEAAS